MASTWSSGGLNLRLMTTGENDNTWGDQTNDNLKRLENKITGYAAVTLSGTTHTLTFTDNPTSYADEDGRNFVLNFGGSPGGTCTVTIPARETVYLVLNNTADSNTITLTTGSGTTFNVPAGKDAFVYSDGTNVYNAMADAIFTTITGDGSALTGVLHDVVDDTTPQLGGNLDLNSNDITGTGNIDITGSGTFTVSDNSSVLTLESTDDDAFQAPVVDFKRNSSSPADNDQMGRLRFLGENDADEQVSYVQISTIARDVTDGTEDGEIYFQVVDNGSLQTKLELGASEVVINESGTDTDFRVESNNDTHCLFVDGGNDNVLIGTTSNVLFNATSGGGMLFENNGVATIARQSTTSTQPLLILNETGTDGTYQQFRRDGSIVGILGVRSTDNFYISDYNNAGITFIGTGVSPVDSNGTGNPNALDLGDSFNTWKDIYMAGTLTNSGSGGMSIDTSGNVVFNEDGGSSDFRVETNTRTHMIFADGSTDRLSIWNNASRADIAINSDNILIGGGSSGSDIFMHSGLGGGFTYAMTISPDFYGQTIFYEGSMSDSADATTSSQNEWLRVKNTETIFNDNSLDKDFRVESNNNTHALVVDGGNDRVGILSTSPPNSLATDFYIDGITSIESASTATLYLARNTAATNGVTAGNIAFIATESTNSNTNRTMAQIKAVAVGAPNTQQPAALEFTTQQNSGSGSAHYRRMRIDHLGDISFYEDTGATAKFFWDASAERLGIGTTSPTQALDVNGTVKATAFQGDGSALTGISSGLSNKFHAWGVNSAGSAAGWRTINFATETVDDDNKFNHTSGTYTVPATGNYVLFAGHFHTNGIHNDYRIRFFSNTNGTLASTSAVDGDRITTSGIMALTINEVIRVDVYHGNNAHADAGGRGSFFGGYRLI